MFHLAPTFHVGNHNARAPLPEVLDHIEDIFTRIAVGSIKRESNPPVVSLVQIEIIVTLAYQFAEYQWIGVDLISPVVLNAITLERIDRAHSRSYLGKGKSH